MKKKEKTTFRDTFTYLCSLSIINFINTKNHYSQYTNSFSKMEKQTLETFPHLNPDGS